MEKALKSSSSSGRRSLRHSSSSSIVPEPSLAVEPSVEGNVGTSPTMATLTKWTPLLLAGVAVGVSFVAIKEMKNVRKEMTELKNKSTSTTDSDANNKKLDSLEQEIKKITEYLRNQNKTSNRIRPTNIVKNARTTPSSKINIVNESESEFTEVEVTDSEAEEETEETEEVAEAEEETEEVEMEEKIPRKTKNDF